jgi:hypothetical protein
MLENPVGGSQDHSARKDVIRPFFGGNISDKPTTAFNCSTKTSALRSFAVCAKYDAWLYADVPNSMRWSVKLNDFENPGPGARHVIMSLSGNHAPTVDAIVPGEP